MKTYLFIFGTRPEAIKLIPLIKKCKNEKDIISIVCTTGQHKEMLNQVLHFFQVKADFELDIMKKNQTLSELTGNCILKLDNVVKETNPDIVFVQGDTTTAFCGALVGFYNKINVAHIEAGLRSYENYSPFPEEVNRKMISTIAKFHFAPTQRAKENLISEGIGHNNIFVVGNTVIDALFLAKEVLFNSNSSKLIEESFPFLNEKKQIVLITCHRRENFGQPLLNICEAILYLAKQFANVNFVFPVHLNPNVKDVVYNLLGNINNIYLIQPLDYPSLVWIMYKSTIVLTDSGGIQEEAPSFGKPVLVMRENTERPEGISSGNAKLVGTKKETIIESATILLTNEFEYSKMSNSSNPYGDGNSSELILESLK